VYKRLYKNLVKIIWDGSIVKPVVYKRLYKTVTQDHHSNSKWYKLVLNNIRQAIYLRHQALQKSMLWYETIIYSPKYKTAYSAKPYAKIDIEHLVCKNTWQCHQEMINLIGSGISSCLLAIGHQRVINTSFSYHRRNREHALKKFTFLKLKAKPSFYIVFYTQLVLI